MLVLVTALVAIVAARRGGDAFVVLLRGAAVGCVAMLLVQPNPTGLRLELVFVPVVAVGLAIALASLGRLLRGRSSLRPRPGQPAGSPGGGAT